eukprot:977613_1
MIGSHSSLYEDHSIQEQYFTLLLTLNLLFIFIHFVCHRHMHMALSLVETEFVISNICDECRSDHIWHKNQWSFKQSIRSLTFSLKILWLIIAILPPLAACMTSGFDRLLRNTSLFTYNETLQYRCSHFVAGIIALGTFIYCYFKLEESFTMNINEITSTPNKDDDAIADISNIQNELDTMYEELLPKEYKTNAFKSRLKKYLILLLIANVLLELTTTAFHSLLPMYHEDNGNGSQSGLSWSHVHHSVNLMLFGGSIALTQVLYRRLNKKYGLFTIASGGALGMIVSYLSIPCMAYVCRWYFGAYSTWLHLSLHSYISILAGSGYGLVMTAGATVFSDFAKKLKHTQVDNWLAAWSFSNSFGCFLILPQTMISDKIGISKTVVCVTLPAAITLLVVL